MMKKLLTTIILLISCGLSVRAQDTLDSISRVHVTVQMEELAVDKFADNNNHSYTWSQELQEMADRGEAAAQNALGSCYLEGNGCKKDVDKALYYFELSAENGNNKALNNLGNLYENGIAVEKNEKQAYFFYKKAALKGHEPAMINLAQCYMRGTGTEVDFQKARAWFEKTIDGLGGRAAIVNTGYLCYQIGDDYDKAFRYLSKGAEMGSPGATQWLAACYMNGYGCTQNNQKAIELFKKVLSMTERLTEEEYDRIRELISELETAH